MFFVFLEERDIKMKQKYIFNYIFNRSGLRNSNYSFLDPLKHNWINLVNYPSYYLVQIPDLGYHNQTIISCIVAEI